MLSPTNPTVPSPTSLRCRRPRRTAGSTVTAHLLVLVVVGVAGTAGFRALGNGLSSAIASEGGSGAVDAGVNTIAGAPPAAAPLSAQAGLVNLMRAVATAASHGDELVNVVRPAKVGFADRVRSVVDTASIAIRRITRNDPPRPELFVAERRFMPAQVRKLREASHRLWVEDLTEGAQPSGLVRDPATGLATVRLGRAGLEVPVGPAPLFRDPEAHKLLAAEPQLREMFGAKHDAQLQGMLARLDDAYDYAFARGFTGVHSSGRTHFLGPDIVRFEGNVKNAFGPPSGWFMVVHGKPDGFMRPTATGAWEDVSLAEIVTTLKASGYTEGQPILLASCSAGACFGRPGSAAQQLADATGAPVVAASNTVLGPASGALFIHGQWEGTLGEWRLFQPNTEKRFPLRRRIAVGRDAHEGELGLASVNELWRVRPGTVERLELAGEWERFMLDNEGALDAAWLALAPGGRIVLRVEHVNPAPFVEALTKRGFAVKRSKAGDFVTVVAVKPKPL
jgi:hypothetical protein